MKTFFIKRLQNGSSESSDSFSAGNQEIIACDLKLGNKTVTIISPPLKKKLSKWKLIDNQICSFRGGDAQFVSRELWCTTRTYKQVENRKFGDNHIFTLNNKNGTEIPEWARWIVCVITNEETISIRFEK
jgi:hypothetical protein